VESQVKIADVFHDQIQGLKKLGGIADEVAQQMEEDLKVSEEVSIRPYIEHPAVYEIVEAFCRLGKSVELGRCFDNSASLARFDERIQCVEGHALAQSNMLIDHAWNCFGNFHFDLTSELALKAPFYGYLASKYLNGMDLAAEDLADN
jgi:hypothetical protein